MSITSLPVLDLSLAQNPDKPPSSSALSCARPPTRSDSSTWSATEFPTNCSAASSPSPASSSRCRLPRSSRSRNVRSPHFRGYTRLGGELTEGKQDWREQIGHRRRTARGRAHRHLTGLGDSAGPQPVARRPSRTSRRHHRVERHTHLDRIEPLTRMGGSPGPGCEHLRRRVRSRSVDPHQGGALPGPPERCRLPGRRRTQGRGCADLCSMSNRAKAVCRSSTTATGSTRRRSTGRWWSTSANCSRSLPGGYLKATVHRVVSPEGDGERISVPFFFNPNYAAQIPEFRPTSRAGGARHRASPWTRTTRSTIPTGRMPSRVDYRAHPDVAARWWPDIVAAQSAT